MMQAGLQTFDKDGNLTVSITRRYGRIIGNISITLPYDTPPPGGAWQAYLARVSAGSGAVEDDGLLSGKPFYFFTYTANPNWTPYGIFGPSVSFDGNKMTWQYVRTPINDAMATEFLYGPASGVLFYGVV